MVKKVRTFALYALIMLVLIIFFLPKAQLYFKVESLLSNYKVYISNETVRDSGLSLFVKEGTIYYDDMAVADFEALSIRPWLAYNAISLSPTELAPEMEQFVPRHIEGLRLYYTPFSPLHVKLEASGAFGEVKGSVALWEHNVSIVLMPSEELLAKKPFWLNKLKKEEEGGYRYETTY